MADEFTKAALYGIKTFNKKVKEKIGIGKLIELLNEYMPNMKREERYNGTEIFTNIHNSNLFICYTERVISKGFGFIKWLVENEKIHREKIPAVTKVDGYLADGSDTEYYNMEESLLMLLSISDTPIEDLLLYLK